MSPSFFTSPYVTSTASSKLSVDASIGSLLWPRYTRGLQALVQC
jgi:hypothetical protein